jgi:hypothetical protein
LHRERIRARWTFDKSRSGPNGIAQWSYDADFHDRRGGFTDMKNSRYTKAHPSASLATPPRSVGEP